MVIQTNISKNKLRYFLDPNKKRDLHHTIIRMSSSRGKSYPIRIMSLFSDQARNVLLTDRMKQYVPSIFQDESSFMHGRLLNQQKAYLNYGLHKRDLPKIELVKYNDIANIKSLLGIIGQHVLGKVTQLIIEISKQNKWPLTKIEVNWIQDYEVKDWQYVCIVLFFDTDFDKADEYLNYLYPQIDNLATSLTYQEQLILQKKLFFDVRANLS